MNISGDIISIDKISENNNSIILQEKCDKIVTFWNNAFTQPLKENAGGASKKSKVTLKKICKWVSTGKKVKMGKCTG